MKKSLIETDKLKIFINLLYVNIAREKNKKYLNSIN